MTEMWTFSETVCLIVFMNVTFNFLRREHGCGQMDQFGTIQNGNIHNQMILMERTA
jgi:hypothetical protein